MQMAEIGLWKDYRAMVKIFISSKQNKQFFINVNFLGIFLEILAEFLDFGRNFFDLFFLRPFELRPLVSLPRAWWWEQYNSISQRWSIIIEREMLTYVWLPLFCFCDTRACMIDGKLE
jgi:hypothetical protein